MHLLLINIIFQESSDFWVTNSFNIEIGFLIVVVILQLIFFSKAVKDTYLLKNIFNESLNQTKVKFDRSTSIILKPESSDLSDSKKNKKIVDLSLLETSGQNDIIIRIKSTINSYLINNYGAAVNFSIIKDIIDREVDLKDEEITQSIPTPLYLGLAATMLGIIFGFLAMPEISGDGDEIFFTGINALIQGVKYAMAASLLGLILTTILSSIIYKSAKKKVLKDKNQQLSYLQAELLPELIKAEDTGVSGLKASLDRFARVATQISDNVLIASNQTGENLVLQQEMMDKFEKMDMIKISNANLNLFSKLDENMNAFKEFSKYLSTMEAISVNLKEFASRTVAVDAIAGQINTSLQDSKKLSQFLTSHLDKIESSGMNALNAVNYADSHFRTSIENLTKEMAARINNMTASAIHHESDLKKIYEDIAIELKKSTTEHIKEFTKSYAEAVPKFEQLDNLKELGPIKNVIETEAHSLKNDSDIHNQNLINKITQLNDSINQLKRDFNTISNTLKTQNTQKKRLKEKENEKAGNDEPKAGNDSSKKRTLLSRFGNMFRFRKNGATDKNGQNKKKDVDSIEIIDNTHEKQ